MIQEAYVSFKTAKLLKRKGFDCECYLFYSKEGKCYWYRVDGILETISNIHCPTRLIEVNCTAPTQQMAMRWLRENHHIHIMVDCLGSSNYLPTIQITNSSKDVTVEGSESRIGGNGFDTYEEAVESALQYVLRNFKNLKK